MSSAQAPAASPNPPSSVSFAAGIGRRGLRSAKDAFTGLVGGIVGVAPHVLHHVGFLAGTALVAGSGGTALFAALGLAASVPMLRRLYRRFGTWRAPAAGLALFAVMFTLSAFVIGPAISGGSDGGPPSTPVVNHNGHH
jgi:hypothetical protein